MNLDIALLLGQDGLTNGAIYALLAIALVLVYAVTRIVFIPQGEFVAYAALTLAEFQYGRVPPTIWLMVVLGLLAASAQIWSSRRQLSLRSLVRSCIVYIAIPWMVAGVSLWLAPMRPPLLVQIALTMAIVTSLGPSIYRLVFAPVASASVLLLLIISVALNFALSGIGLLMFGAEGVRTEAVTSQSFEIGVLTITGQSLWVIAASGAAMAGLYAFFRLTIYGKALRATAVNRIGAKLLGIRSEIAGGIVLTFAVGLGAACGVLIAPLTTIYYDSGFLIGLKGFVAAIIGGLVSYPAAAAGAILVGLLESFSSFWASAFKEVIVFTLIVPVLLWRSLHTLVIEGDEE
ncbi:branched-chain amino acid ABC transporter permease [Pseudorhodoplanes sp.]|uniref:branched-chain amino acid ABC transporter permease n=1 Tax=Pseudorhodoplanes sp. TaxID=1934341 RepID=UPI003D0D6179